MSDDAGAPSVTSNWTPSSTSTLLLTFFVGNDVHDNMRWPPQSEANEWSRLQAAESPSCGECTILYKRSTLYAAVQMWLRRRALNVRRTTRSVTGKSELMLFMAEGAGVLGAQMPMTANALADLNRAVREPGIDSWSRSRRRHSRSASSASRPPSRSWVLTLANARPDAVSQAVIDVLTGRASPTVTWSNPCGGRTRRAGRCTCSTTAMESEGARHRGGRDGQCSTSGNGPHQLVLELESAGRRAR